MSKLLTKGDVIYLKKGMTVYSSIPEKFIYDNSISDDLRNHDVTIGKNYSSKKNIDYESFINKESKRILKSANENGFIIDIKEITSFLNLYLNVNPVSFWKLNPGKFIVINTKFTGGSYGRDPYPDGHFVICRRLSDDNKILDEEISFYQSGCFTAMITDINPIDHLDIIESLTLSIK